MTAPTDHDLPPLNATPPGLYRHYKGGWYEVISPPALALPGPPRGCDRSWGGPASDHDTVRCSETLQGMTLYRALYGGFGLWVRPAAMFAERGVFGGQEQPRFTHHDPGLLPLGDLATAQALIVHLRGRAQRERGIDLDTALRPPPPEPDSCCGRGCNGCVWEGFYEALHHWRVDALELLGPHAPPLARVAAPQGG
jgi:hypothetical protein